MPVRKSVIFVFAALAFAGCQDMFAAKAPPRNFDELVPRMLGAIKNRAPEDAAVNLFNVTSPDERRDAIAFLETQPYGHNPPYMAAYQLLAKEDPHPMVRAQAMRALGSSHQPEAVEFLVRGLNDSDVQVRRDAATGLINTFGEAAIAPLTQHVKQTVEPDPAVRVNSARALRNSRSPESVRALIDALEDRDVAVTFYAHESLVTVTGQGLGPDPREWLTWYQQTNSPAATQRTP